MASWNLSDCACFTMCFNLSWFTLVQSAAFVLSEIDINPLAVGANTRRWLFSRFRISRRVWHAARFSGAKPSTNRSTKLAPTECICCFDCIPFVPKRAAMTLSISPKLFRRTNSCSPYLVRAADTMINDSNAC
ncbi:hypothetical protein PF005_g2906 [Phytophthora fragariae]|uniref:Secreted protein n=1 Tax=Phytophthora fragariae TaxID=53985 RepID=A0A6A3ZAA8_9STRA|nr:hypothetical protein PF005_g2906 [Phytophthora fragariae]